MEKPHEDRGLLSRLPDDDGYWQHLTDRIVADAAGPLRAYGRSGRRWWQGLARWAAPLTVGAAAAVIASLLWLPDAGGGPSPGPSPASVYGLEPADPLAAPFLTSPTAPTMATLLATPTAEPAR